MSLLLQVVMMMTTMGIWKTTAAQEQDKVASNPEDGIPAIGLEQSAFVLVPPEEEEWSTRYSMEGKAAAMPFLHRDSQQPQLQMCKPRHIHLSLGSEPTHESMTISFSIPRSTNETEEETTFSVSCDPSNLRVSVVYGEKRSDASSGDSSSMSSSSFSEASSSSAWLSPWWDHHHHHHKKEGSHRIYATDRNWTSYNHRSLRDGSFYQSDWLYHMQLHGILKSATSYWYRIEVEQGQYAAATTPSSSFWSDVWGYYRVNPEPAHTVGRNLRGGAGVAAAMASEANYASHVYVGDGSHFPIVGTSPTLTFTTPPAPPSSSSPFQRTKFSIVGDLGQTYNSTVTMCHMWQESHLSSSDDHHHIPASLLLIAGDMSYADSDQVRWDNWFTLIEPLLSEFPLVVTAGNHEIECNADSKEVFVPYEERFYMPNRRGPARTQPVEEAYRLKLEDGDCTKPSVFQGHYDGGNSYYTFVYGPVRVISLSSYSDTAEESEQYVWLEETLQEAASVANREAVPWIIVMMHTQWYTTFPRHVNEIQTTVMREAMEPLFIQYQVNLVFCGHDHGYMRTKSMAYGESDPTEKSPIYIIVGEGGNREHHDKNYINPDQPEEWVMVRDKTEYGFGTLDFINATAVQWTWIRDRKEGTFSDSVLLENSYFRSL